MQAITGLETARRFLSIQLRRPCTTGGAFMSTSTITEKLCFSFLWVKLRELGCTVIFNPAGDSNLAWYVELSSPTLVTTLWNFLRLEELDPFPYTNMKEG